MPYLSEIKKQSVQLIELHAFVCDLVCVYLSELLHFLKIDICNIVLAIVVVARVSVATCLGATEVCTPCLCVLGVVHLLAGSLEDAVQFGHSSVDAGDVLPLFSSAIAASMPAMSCAL